MEKGQIQIGESIMVIIIIMIIGVIALVFYVRLAEYNYTIKLDEYEDLSAIETAQLATNLYELRCAKPGVAELCFDVHKIIGMTELWQNENELVADYYFDVFGNAKVTIEAIHPNNETYLIYWNNASDEPKGQESIDMVMPVPIHNSSQRTISFGILRIERYFAVRG